MVFYLEVVMNHCRQASPAWPARLAGAPRWNPRLCDPAHEMQLRTCTPAILTGPIMTYIYKEEKLTKALKMLKEAKK